MNSPVPGILFSSGISALIVIIVLWIFREWISARLRSGIQHRYDKQLETLKAELTVQNEAQLLSAKNDLERQHAVYESMRSSFSEGQKSSMERKLNAVDRLWSEVLTIRNLLPPSMTVLDAFREDEIARYWKVRKSSEGSKIFDSWSLDKFKKNLKSLTVSVEDTRPYVGEYLWSVHNAYKVVHVRLAVLLQLELSQLDESESHVFHWYNDEVNREVIEAILSDEESQCFRHLAFGKHSWLQKTLELKMLSQMRKIISGETYLEDTLEKLGTDALEKIRNAEFRAKDLSSRFTR